MALSDVNLKSMLNISPTTYDFDINKMNPTDGKRSVAYLKLLKDVSTYSLFWKCLSSSRIFTIADGAMSKEEHKMQQVVHDARYLELNAARGLMKEITQKWHPDMG